MPAVSLAAPTNCAPAPTAYAGSDDAAKETSGLRSDLATDCKALTDRLDQVDGHTTDNGGKLDTLHTDLGQPLHVQLYDKTSNPFDDSNRLPVHDDSTSATGANGGSNDHPSYVKLASSDMTAPTLRDGFNSEVRVAWFIAGALVALLAAYKLLRIVLPGKE